MSSPRTTAPRRPPGYNKVRGDKVIAYARGFLDEAVPLESGSWADATGVSVDDGRLQVAVADGSVGLADPDKFIGYTGELGSPEWSVLLVNNGLHIEILIDPQSPVGSTDKAGIKDVVLESAVTTIQDFEDSVAAVDADDKVLGYRNWLGLNRGDLAEEVTKDGKTFTRVLNRGPHLQDTRRRRAHPARPQPAVRPQRRTPDDQRRDRRRRRRTRCPRASRTRCSPA